MKKLDFSKNLSPDFFLIKIMVIIIILLNSSYVVQSQNAIVGTGFSSGWGSGCTSPNGTDYIYFSPGINGTYTSGDLTPIGTGNKYWRLAVGWSGTFYQISGGSDIAVTPGTKNSSVVSCAEMGAWFRNISSLSNKYVFKTLNAGISPTGTWVFFELSGSSATVNWVAQNPSNPTVNDEVIITATLSGSLPTGQGVYLRYTTDNWATSAVSSMGGSGSTYSANIGMQSVNTVVKYYIFTSGSGLTISPTDVDLFTINWNAGSINGGNNYAYTVTSASATTYVTKYLFDFGPNDVTNGDITPITTDANGNYWNNINNTTGNTALSGTFTGIKNASGTSTAYGLAFISAFTTNGKLNGGLLSPYASQFNSDPDLSLATATQDYMFTQASSSGTAASFKLTGLNTAKKYRFRIFGCRNSNSNRTSNYTIQGNGSAESGTLNSSSVSGLGGTQYFADGSTPGSNFNLSYKLFSQTGFTNAGTYYGNNNSVYTSGYFSPNSSGEITVSVYASTGGFAYLNSMKIEEYKGSQTITFSSLPAKAVGDADFIPGATSSSGLTISYTSSNTAVATIVDGQIHIIGEGTTDITASQAGNADYDSAASVSQTLTVSSNSNLQQTFLFDFGTNGYTTGTDVNGKTWNDITSSNTYNNLKNTVNVSSAYSLSFPVSMSFNGPTAAYGLSTPEISKLGDMAISNATIDFAYSTTSGQLKLSGLDLSKGYKFYLFGTRDAAETRITKYELSGITYYSAQQQTSGTNLGGAGINCNNSTFSTSEIMLPSQTSGSSTGEILLDISLISGSYDYLNMMKVEEYLVEQVNTTSIVLNGNDIAQPAQTSQMSVTYNPENATNREITWSVDNTNLATISKYGLLTPKSNGTVTVTASISQNGSTISNTKQISISNQTSTLYVCGTSTSAGDNIATALPMNLAQGTSGDIAGTFELSTTLTSGGTLRFYTKTDGSGSLYGAGASSNTIALNGTAISNSTTGEVLIRVYLSTLTYKVIATNAAKISQMGSSVCYGTGSTAGNQSYFYNYSQLLSSRYSTNNALTNWSVSNISVPGNNTIALFKRWDNDLLNNAAKYVLYGLSLGNEGISGTGLLNDGTTGSGLQIYDQFKSNMLLLIDKAESVGKIPVVGTNNPRNSYTVTVYDTYIKPMNIEMAQWDVPSINLLGAIEDGNGKFVSGYYADDLHPNSTGYLEMSYAIVPSLFDALKSGKAQPALQSNQSITLGKLTNPDLLNFSPENTTHSFTTVFDVKTTSSGTVSTFTSGAGVGAIEITSTGYLKYTSPGGGSITGSAIMNDGNWHKVTLTHYYARGITFLYTDAIQANTSISEQLVPETFTLNHANSPDNIMYRNWFFFRAGMNADEIAALCQDKMLKSSLELYAPLNGDDLTNQAQSTNSIQRTINTVTTSTTGNASDLLSEEATDIIVSAGELTLNQNKNYNTVTVNAGAKVSLLPGISVNCGSVNLKSDATGTGTFVDNNNSAPQSVIGTVQQYITAARNWYISSPVTTATAAGLNLGTSVQTYNEATKSWSVLNSGDALLSGKGYVSVAKTGDASSTGIVNFTGTFNTGTITVPVTRTESGSSRGFNLVANPYPSYLDWSLVKADVANVNIGSTLWFRTKTSEGAYTFATYNNTGNVSVSNGASTTITKFIPPMQAFWIRVNSGTASTNVTFKNTMRAHRDDNGNTMKAPKSSDRVFLRLTLENELTSDETLIYFDADASDAFDNYDSPKLLNNSTLTPDFYSMSGLEKLTINGLKVMRENMEIPLGFSLNAVATLKIKTTEMSNFVSGTRLFLLDKIENTQTEILPGSEYTFSTSSETTSSDLRFSVLFRVPAINTGLESSGNLNAHVYLNALNQIVIAAPVNCDYAIYNAAGQLLKEAKMNSDIQTVNIRLQTGLYIIKVTNNDNEKTIRLIL